jgi:anti-sigma regulatory factor (Ser/Thr protein kinase)
VFSVIRIGALVLLNISLAAQGLPDLIFQNIDLWAERNGAIQVIEDTEGYLWMTSAMGVHRFDGKHVRSYFQQSDTLSISANYTEMLFEDREQNIWIGTTLGGVDKYIRADDHFVRVISPAAGIGHVVRMLQDPNGMLWICGAHGLFSLDPESGTLVRFVPGIPSKDPGGYGFRGAAQDRTNSQMLWIVGLDGAYHFDKVSHVFESLEVPDRPGGLYMLMDVHETASQDLWSATWFGGLMHYNIASHDWQNFIPEDLHDGRWYDVFKASLPLDENRIWVAGGAGFGIFDRTSEAFSFYPFELNGQGALDSSFSYGGICMTRQGNMVVTGLKGFSISSSLSGGDRLFFAPAMQAVEVEGKPISADRAISQLDEIYLDEREKTIAFTLTTPGNYSDASTEFTYRLEGYEKDWQYLTGGTMVRYTNLPRGNYRFLFRARIGQQDWLEGRPLVVEKEIAFFMQPWFYATLGFILAGFIFLIYRLRVQRIRNEEKLKTEFNKRIADTEMAVLRSQMNPHFMFNSLNSIKYYILNEETDHANKYLTKFSKLMRLVLKNSQSRLVNLSEELEALKLYIELESLRFKEDFKYEINVDVQIDQDDTYVPPLIIQPYVENAIWHGLLQKDAPGNLEVSIDRKNGMIHVQVTDDGIGREAAEALRSKSATKKSFGTRITRDRITLVREIIGVDASVVTDDLRDSNGKPSGTRVVIAFPFIDGHQMDDLKLN